MRIPYPPPTLLRRSLGCAAIITSLLALGTLPVLGQAAPPHVTSVDPARHMANAPRGGNVELIFSESIDAFSIDGIQMHARMSTSNNIRQIGIATSHVTLDPTLDFGPGDLVEVSVPSSVNTESGRAVAPFVYRFHAAAGSGPGTFGAGDPLPVSGAYNVQPCDIDHDGDLDLLVADHDGGQVHVITKAGSGVLMLTATVAVGVNPRVVACDIDNDGDVDFLTCNEGSSSISIATNDGTGTFTVNQTLALASISPTSLAVGDLDGDGDLDACAAMVGSNEVEILTNTGGIFGGGILSAPGGPCDLTLGDCDDDGDLDVLTANSVAGTVSIFLNDGLGQGAASFTSAGDLAVGRSPKGIACADLDGDGHLDFVVCNQEDNSVSVCSGDGTGAFSLSQTVPVGRGPVDVELADVDGDGDLDICTANSGAASVSVCLRQFVATGIYTPGRPQATRSFGVTSLAAGDMDGDGDLDLVTASFSEGTITVLTNQELTQIVSVSPAPNTYSASRSQSLTVTLAGPADPAAAPTARTRSKATGIQNQRPASPSSTNVITLSPGPPEPVGLLLPAVQKVREAAARMSVSFQWEFGIRPAPSGGQFTSWTNVPNAAPVVAGSAHGDFDNDGDIDLVTISCCTGAPGENGLAMYRNDGTGALTFFGSCNVVANPVSVTCADFDNDGDVDVAVAGGASPAQVTVCLNNGAGAFTPSTRALASQQALWIDAADVDSDGDADLLVACVDPGASSEVAVLPNVGGAFPFTQRVPVDGLASCVTTGDLDGDGFFDLFVADSQNNRVLAYQNDGTGDFLGVPVARSTGFRGGIRVAVGDVNADGRLDLMVCNSGDGTLSLFRGAPSGFDLLTSPITISTGLVTHPTELTLADVDGDGDLDWIAAGTDAGGAPRVRVSRLTPGSSSVLTDYTTDANPVQLACVDMDSDHDLDLVITGSGAGGGPHVRLHRNSGLSSLTISTTMTVPPGDYQDITVTGTGVATLGGNVTVGGALVVQAGGVLDDGCAVISGSGSFTLSPGATLHICHPQGISASGPTGAIQVTGTRSFSGQATYHYDGTVAQITGTGLPEIVNVLLADNAVSVALTRPTSIRQYVEVLASQLTTSGQTLTLLSDATGTACAMDTAGHIVGTVRANAYLTPLPGGQPGYRHMSPPVTNTTVADLATTGFVPVVNNTYNTAPNPSAVRPFPNVFGYNEARMPAAADFGAGWFSPVNLTSPLVSGRGYSVYVKGSRTIDFVGAVSQAEVTMTGLTRTGNNLGNAEKSGWHMLGNPYPSPLDWDALPIPAGMSTSVSVFKSTGGNNGSYLTRANGMGTLPEGLLPIGQAFFCRVTGAGPVDFLLKQSARRKDYVGHVTLMKRQAPDPRPVVSVVLRQPNAPADQQDETVVYCQAGATAGYDDAFDGARPRHNEGAVPTLVTLAGAEELGVNGLPETVLTRATTVELLADLPLAGTYTLQVGRLANLPTTTGVALLDRLTNTQYDLTQQPIITFAAAQAGEVRGRFALVLNPAGTVTGTERSEKKEEVSLWPNPAHGSVLVSLPPGAALVEVLDAAGRVVRVVRVERPAATSSQQVDLTGLSAGVYTVRVGAHARRLVVE